MSGVKCWSCFWFLKFLAIGFANLLLREREDGNQINKILIWTCEISLRLRGIYFFFFFKRKMRGGKQEVVDLSSEGQLEKCTWSFKFCEGLLSHCL